jgi:hypothetical protein
MGIPFLMNRVDLDRHFGGSQKKSHLTKKHQNTHLSPSRRRALCLNFLQTAVVGKGVLEPCPLGTLAANYRLYDVKSFAKK